MSEQTKIFHLEITITKEPDNSCHVTSSFPEDATVMTIMSALHTLANGLEAKIKQKADAIGFDEWQDCKIYLDSLTMNDIA